MKLFSIILSWFVFAGTAFADERQFINRWKNHDEQIVVNDDFRRYYNARTELLFSELDEYRGPLPAPPGIGGDIETALVLHSDRDITLLLVTPKNLMKNVVQLNEDYRKTRSSCADDRSWVVVLPENKWTPVNLNPYCSMNYREDTISINLYWTDRSAPPLIELVTDDLECVPHYLYGWGKSLRKYVLRSTKCTGARRLENYGTGPNLQQVYP